MANELNGQGLPVRIHNLLKTLYRFEILWCMPALTIGSLINFGLLFAVVCFVLVFDQTLVEHLFIREKCKDAD